MTLDDLEKLVGDAIDPRDIFGEDVAGNLERFRAICQPDRNPGQEERAAAVLNALEQFAQFTPEDVEAIARAEAVFRSLPRAGGSERPAGPPVTVASPAAGLYPGRAARHRRPLRRLPRRAAGAATTFSRSRGSARGAHLLEAEHRRHRARDAGRRRALPPVLPHSGRVVPGPGRLPEAGECHAARARPLHPGAGPRAPPRTRRATPGLDLQAAADRPRLRRTGAGSSTERSSRRTSWCTPRATGSSWWAGPMRSRRASA